MKEHGILKRFGVTLGANAAATAVAFAASLVLARGLGASAYGDYNFLLSSFAAINTWLEFGTPTAFYTFMAKGKDGRLHCRFFSLWLALRFAAIVLAVGLLLPQSLLSKIWLGHARGLVLLAFIGFYLSTPLRSFLVQTAESVRRTVFIQTALATLSFSHLALILALLVSGRLSVPHLFLLLIVEYSVLGLYFLARFDWSQLASSADDLPIRTLFDRYAAFCAPLILYSFINFPCEFADRWLLQYFGGSAQQGFFSLSWQFASIALLATTALLNIFWKEIADAEHRGDRPRVRELYGRSARALFFVSAAGGCFLIPHSRTLLARLAGPAFASAWPALSLMFLYPAFQTLGQLNGAFFYATEDTKTHVAISSTGILLGLPLTYFVLAPASARIPGLGLGANGLAARWSLLQMAVVSVQSWIAARRHGGDSHLAHHFLILGGLLALGQGCRTAAATLTTLLPSAAADLWTLAFSALFYGAATAAFVLTFPEHAGSSRQQIQRILRWRPFAP